MPERQEDVDSVRCDGSGPEPKWFVAYTATHHEKHVRKHLADRHVESFLPLYTVCRRWKRRSPESAHLPLFPNYIFIRISRAERSTVLATPGVFSIVGTGQNAWELPEREIEALRCGLHERKAEPHPYLALGERVRVTSGVLAGLEGVILRRKSNLHIVITLDRIMQSIAIEVEASELGFVPERSSQGLITGTVP